jgi:hypothetical protein
MLSKLHGNHETCQAWTKYLWYFEDEGLGQCLPKLLLARPFLEHPLIPPSTAAVESLCEIKQSFPEVVQKSGMLILMAGTWVFDELLHG